LKLLLFTGNFLACEHTSAHGSAGSVVTSTFRGILGLKQASWFVLHCTAMHDVLGQLFRCEGKC
jgi:hypothetical protein